MVFRLKKELAPTTTITTKGGERRTVQLYPIYEDLTKPAHQLLQDLLKDPRMGPVWTIGGHIWYRLKNDDTVKGRFCFDSVDDILGDYFQNLRPFGLVTAKIRIFILYFYPFLLLSLFIHLLQLPFHVSTTVGIRSQVRTCGHLA
jgi:hypothetical protein